jgi:hypothetical protein
MCPDISLIWSTTLPSYQSAAFSDLENIMFRFAEANPRMCQKRHGGGHPI